MLKPILIGGALLGLGYGGYYLYRRKQNQITDLTRLQITLGGFRDIYLRQGFLFLPVDLSINNPTNSDLDLRALDLRMFAEITLLNGGVRSPLFAGDVDLTETKLPKHSIVQVPVTLQAPLLGVTATAVSAVLPGIVNLFVKDEAKKLKQTQKTLQVKLTPRLHIQELQPISFSVPLNNIEQKNDLT